MKNSAAQGRHKAACLAWILRNKKLRWQHWYTGDLTAIMVILPAKKYCGGPAMVCKIPTRGIDKSSCHICCRPTPGALILNYL